jgi:nitrite reductase/ring-hydroxylating ferredoxin subunit
MTWNNAIKSTRLKEGKKKMVTVKGKLVMVTRQNGAVLATEALCRHMRWPLAYGGKIKDGCIRCPLHQTTHDIETGELKEWSPFPLLPAYGKLVGKMSKKKDLRIYEARDHEGMIQIRFDSPEGVQVGSLN